MIRVDRKNSDKLEITNPCLTISLFMQSDVLNSVLQDEEFRLRGLAGRFMYCSPKPNVGNRKAQTASIPTEVESKFYSLIEEIMSIPVVEERRVLTLSPKAVQLSQVHFNEINARIGVDGDLRHMADWAGKLHGAILRFAGLLHVMEHVELHGKDFNNHVIDIDTFKSAVLIGYYYLEQARTLYALTPNCCVV